MPVEGMIHSDQAPVGLTAAFSGGHDDTSRPVNLNLQHLITHHGAASFDTKAAC
jgi:hypothetical protein